MRLNELRVAKVRNLTEVCLQPAPLLNAFYGANGAGKTALFEAVYLLARGKSFRTHRIGDLQQQGTDGLSVVAYIQRTSGTEQVITSVERIERQLAFRYQGELVRTLSTQARQMPLLFVGPEVSEILFGSPKIRRHWLDWAMFHVEPEFLTTWQDYHRALKQRNSLLRGSMRSTELDSWESTLAQLAATLNRGRQEFLAGVQQAFDRSGSWTGPRLQLVLEPGWSEALPLQETLRNTRSLDREFGHTRHGAHRADVKFLLDDRDAARFLSRGQSRRLLNLLRIAEAHWLAECTGQIPLLLLDDFGAELDVQGRVELCATLRRFSGQVFLNTPDAGTLVELGGAATVFHVEHGRVMKMVK
jgi:DNA replication and repair protein RecF